jgi:type II secretory pathway pseudopilin PulG
MGSPPASGHVRLMRGHSLIELLFVLVLAAVGASALVPTARKLRDRAVTASLREALVVGFVEARTSAVRHGGATLTLRRASPAYRVDTKGRTGAWISVHRPHVRLRLDGQRDSISIDFDRMGLGRLASHSIDVFAGDVRRRLVVSSYGRVRRQ